MERYCHRIGTEPPSGSGYEHLEISLLFWFGTTVISWKYFAEIFPFCSQNECPCSVVDVRWRKTVLILWHLYRASELWIKSSKTTGTELTHWQLTSQRHFNNLLLPANPTPVLSGRYDVSISSAEVLDPPWPARRFVWMLLQSAEWHYPVNVCNAESKYNRARYALPIPHPFAEALRWRWMTSLRASPLELRLNVELQNHWGWKVGHSLCHGIPVCVVSLWLSSALDSTESHCPSVPTEKYHTFLLSS